MLIVLKQMFVIAILALKKQQNNEKAWKIMKNETWQ